MLEEAGDGNGLYGGGEGLGEGVEGGELEEVAAAVGEEKDRHHQNDQEEDGEQEKDWEQRHGFPDWRFGGRRWGRFAH